MMKKIATIAAAFAMLTGMAFTAAAQQCAAPAKAEAKCVCADKTQCKTGKCDTKKCTPCDSEKQACAQKAAKCQKKQKACDSNAKSCKAAPAKTSCCK